MNNLRDDKQKNYNLFVRGSKGRIGREIVKYFMLENSNSTAVEISRFGGSFTHIINNISNVNVFFVTNVIISAIVIIININFLYFGNNSTMLLAVPVLVLININFSYS